MIKNTLKKAYKEIINIASIRNENTYREQSEKLIKIALELNIIINNIDEWNANR